MRIDGVNYDLDWENFTIGSSFFVPCLSVTDSTEYILRKMWRLGYNVRVKVVVEDGVQGLRVWRVKRTMPLQPAVANWSPRRENGVTPG